MRRAWGPRFFKFVLFAIVGIVVFTGIVMFLWNRLVPPIFGWHAWAEVHDGKQWVSVDPTWNELYVDATHIVFTHDTGDHAWLNVLGTVKFTVLEVKKKEE